MENKILRYLSSIFCACLKNVALSLVLRPRYDIRTANTVQQSRYVYDIIYKESDSIPVWDSETGAD